MPLGRALLRPPTTTQQTLFQTNNHLRTFTLNRTFLSSSLQHRIIIGAHMGDTTTQPGGRELCAQKQSPMRDTVTLEKKIPILLQRVLKLSTDRAENENDKGGDLSLTSAIAQEEPNFVLGQTIDILPRVSIA